MRINWINIPEVRFSKDSQMWKPQPPTVPFSRGHLLEHQQTLGRKNDICLESMLGAMWKQYWDVWWVCGSQSHVLHCDVSYGYLWRCTVMWACMGGYYVQNCPLLCYYVVKNISHSNVAPLQNQGPRENREQTFRGAYRHGQRFGHIKNQENQYATTQGSWKRPLALKNAAISENLKSHART